LHLVFLVILDNSTAYYGLGREVQNEMVEFLSGSEPERDT
jgi:hypothetical protein